MDKLFIKTLSEFMVQHPITDENNVALPIIFTGVENEVPNTPFLQISFLFPNKPALTVNGITLYNWIMQISVYTRDGVGLIKPLAIAEQLNSLFPFAQLVGQFKTNSVPQIRGSVSSAKKGWNFIPVDINFHVIGA